jgi:uncharacterized protein
MKQFSPVFMIVPGMACQASCTYCFGPHNGISMTESIAEKTLDFIAAIAEETQMKTVSVIFHGGEPLLAPFWIWEKILQGLPARIPQKEIRWSVQSNLWALDDRFCELFRKHNVSVGTSIDGPKEICDITRGKGYWERTMNGIALARRYGIDVGAIATLTNNTALHWKEVVDFFMSNNLSLNLHPALNPLGKLDSDFSLSTEGYANLLAELLPYYVQHHKQLSISTIDNFVKACVHGDGEVCTFRDCFGMFLSIAPDGNIYSCQRFCGKPEYSLGNVADKPTLTELMESPVGIRFQQREKEVAKRCAACVDYAHCHGGCTYNALSSGDGVIDPMCEAYHKTFELVRKQLITEMAMPENIEAIAARAPREHEHTLLRKGPLISLSGKVHPKEMASNARSVLCFHALGKHNNAEEAAKEVVERKICGGIEQTKAVMQYYHNIAIKPSGKYINLYAQITYNCNLHCTHCYANADSNTGRFMDTGFFEKLMSESLTEKFNKVIITGGEPLVHPERNTIFDICKKHRGKGVLLVLRTNMAGKIPDTLLTQLAASFDQVVVSVDGNETTHDARRGKGQYSILINNIERYQKLSGNVSLPGELSIGCTMNSADINGEPGQSVQQLAEKLKIRKIRFRPFLPIGRAANGDDLMCERITGNQSSKEVLESRVQVLNSCGLGQNLNVEPEGESFPCIALHRPETMLGNVRDLGLKKILESESFQQLQNCTVDTIEKCKECEVRYLCGGACRAWGNESNQLSLNAAPPNCEHLKKRAFQLIESANQYLFE